MFADMKCKKNYFVIISFALTTICTASLDIDKHPSWMLLDHDNCGNSNADRIIGGKNATMGMYPWIVRLGYTSQMTVSKKISFRCGGTLINKLYVVTAAHCVVKLPGGYKLSAIRMGEHNTETNPDCENGDCADPVQDIAPTQIIVHKDYNFPLFKNDIAIIRLNYSVTYNDFVKPICMPHGSLLTKDFINETAEAAGWGLFKLDSLTTSTILQTIKLPILATEVCEKLFRHHRAQIDNRQMCVGGKIGEDSCTGDSGGPLMKVEAVDGPPRYYFTGIVSFGIKNCGETATPAVYTRISAYINWILENVSP